MADYFVKDPQAKLDYKVDWSQWLIVDDAIVASSWTVPEGLTKEQEEYSAREAVVWLSGGELNAQYAVTNSIVTAGGRKDDRTFSITIKQK